MDQKNGKNGSIATFQVVIDKPIRIRFKTYLSSLIISSFEY